MEVCISLLLVIMPAAGFTRDELKRLLGKNINALELVQVQESTDSNVKVLCWVNTYDKNHDRARSIKATWGKRCDKIVFMSNVEDLSLPTVPIGNALLVVSA